MTDQDPTQAYAPLEAAPQAPVPAPADAAVPDSIGTPSAPPAGYAAAAPVGYVPAAPPAPPAILAAPAMFAAPEPTPAGPVPTEPVEMAPVAGRKPGRSPVRWLAAALVTLVVVGLAAGATMFLTSDAGDPGVLAWTPADSVAYTELRLDLPGSQQAELARLMKAFPGFEDQAAFPVKLSEILDQLVDKASGGKQSYKADIEPWFSGQVGASVGPLPSKADAAQARFLLLLSTKDGAKAQAWLAAMLAAKSVTTSAGTYSGVTLALFSAPASDTMAAGVQGASALVGPTLAIGDVASVKAAIDTAGKTGLPSNAQFKTARASISGDRLVFGYVDAAAIVKGAAALADGSTGGTVDLGSLASNVSGAWAVATVRAKDGALVVDTRMPHNEKAGPAKNAESRLPALVPASTVVLVEGHDVGEAIARTKDALAADPKLKDTVKQVEDALGIIGGFDAATGWIGEAGIAITRTGDQVGGGIVIVPTDAKAADHLFLQLKAFVQLGGSQYGLAVKDEDYKGTTITTVDLSALGALAGAASGGSVSAPDNISLSYATAADVVVLGYGPDFVKAVLDARTGDSLAKSNRFAAALKLAGPTNASLVWIDVTAFRDLAESMVPAADKADYDANIKPYLAGFDSVIGTTTPGETVDAGTLIIRTTGG
ncbi:MAG: DUF3352 domain-containing protein [Chloroflexota bacterium]